MTWKLLEEKTFGGNRLEVIDYGKLAGSADAATAEKLYFLREAGMALKSVRVTLANSSLLVEPGALYYMQGKLGIETKVGGVLSGLMRSLAAGETLFANQIAGTGMVMLEPSFGHFLLVEIENDELVCDKGMFYAAVGDLTVKAKVMGLSAAVFGGEGIFQTVVKGTGVVVLMSPVPMEELVSYELTDGILSVDGNFALMRVGDINFTVKKSSKSWLHTAVSGEGLLQTFSGTGTVWLAPTQKIYQQLLLPGALQQLAEAGAARNNRT
ncbi:AIM24 family protein [Cereibacter sphaeroides]|uniref:AIM24 family protein n=1 Tax=Cereibacter sphaeroides TaxID=1063 RepID=UPI001F3F9AE1|nr:AIM24 family protein [Cereibacter sphaeroides]MCE6957747.1 AIM24 family protein [Cereibacter sphaeroides]MCE6971627.1 AIM24 family protein [Cereibacter sphaeroides]